MTIREDMAKHYFGPGNNITFGLRLNGREVSRGFSHETPAWAVKGNEAETMAVFNFDHFVSFDEVVVKRGDIVVESFRQGQEVTIPEGAVWRHSVKVEVR